MNVGGDNKSQGGTCHYETHAKEQQLVELGAGAGELEELREVTVEVVDHTGTTEVECGYGYSVVSAFEKAQAQDTATSILWTVGLMRVL